RVLPGHALLVNVGPKALAADQQPLFGHHLHLLQGGGVDALPAERFMDFADRTQAALPQRRQDFQFGAGGKWGHTSTLVSLPWEPYRRYRPRSRPVERRQPYPAGGRVASESR